MKRPQLEVCYKDTAGVYKRVVCDELDRGPGPAGSLASSMEHGVIIARRWSRAIGDNRLAIFPPTALSWARVKVPVKRQRKTK